mmetsp:Transcript_22767/g.53830  ORF Transcript_22767/g.53830 Transcript_22767/m.53830 type:complete len:463 (+) Transcript_22767:139-1527(+)
MSNWQPSGRVYSDYTPVEKRQTSDLPVLPTAEMLQADDGDDRRDMAGRSPVSSYSASSRQQGGVKVLSVRPSQSSGVPSVLNTAPPNPPPRTSYAASSESTYTPPQAPQPYVPPAREPVQQRTIEDQDFPPSSGEELTPQQLMEAASNWAKRNGFSPEQLQEFSHLITMVSATYIPRSQISSFRGLDQGSFGMIYSAVYDGATVAVKQCSSDGSQIKAKMRELLLELSVLVRIRHPNVVTFWGTAADFPSNPNAKPYIGMVFELCSRGSLYKTLHNNSGKPVPFKDKMRFALEVARGMAYIHSKGIIHRDLNSRNILLTDTSQAKVADFGCARKLKGAALVTTTISGSPAYMAPEQLEGKDLTDKVDVWAYGVLLWEIATEQVPWASKGNSLDALKRSVCVKKERLPTPGADRFPQGWRTQYIKLMEWCWNLNPTSRPSMSEMARGIEAMNNQESVSVGEFM